MAAVLLAACTSRGWAQSAPETSVAGEYHRVGATAASLEVVRGDDGFEVVLTGGSPPGDGQSAPADCIIRAGGQLQAGSLTGVFQAVSTAGFSYSQAQAAAEQRILVVVFSPGSADVTRADTFGYCGLGSNFLGKYRRLD